MLKYQWLVKQLTTLIRKNIRDGITKLPAEQELCKRYRLSRQTVRMALNVLEEEGFIVKKRGSGSFITGYLGQARGNEIGLLVYDDQDYIYPGIIHDIRKVLAQDGFSCTAWATQNEVSRERELLKNLLKQTPRGLIIEGCKTALPNPNLDLYRQLIKKDCELLFLFNYYPALADCLYLKGDNFSGSSLLVRHLASQGHTAIGGIFKADDMQGIERYQGFAETLCELGLPLVDSRICWYSSRELDKLLSTRNTRFLMEMVQENLSSCTAVVCYNDIIAYHLINVLMQLDYQLPESMAVTAFDNTYFSNSDILTITTLSHHPHEMGTKAAHMLLNKIKGLPVHAQEAQWYLNLKESTSVALPKQHHSIYP